jgi:hypothetical protein
MPIRFCYLICGYFLLSPLSIADPWPRHTIDDSSRGADGVRLGDINRDGLPDIATAWEEGGVVRVTLHPGHDRVREPWPAVTVGRVKSGEDAVFADVDGDGQLDVVSACEGDTRSIFVHWAPSNLDALLDESAWRTEVLPASEGRMQFMFVLPMDVNNDGRTDLVTGAKNDGAQLGWYEAPDNPRDLKSWTWHALAGVGWVMSIRPFDSNNDGRMDLFVTDRRGDARGVWCYWQPRDPRPNWPRTLLGGSESEVMFGDIRSVRVDQFELAWAVRGGPVQWKHGLATQRQFPMPENAGTGKAATFGDINGDGLADVVVTCENAANKLGVFAYLRPPANHREADWPFMDIGGLAGTKFDRIELVDLDGDGDLDVLTCEERENLGVIWYENQSGPAPKP